MAHSQLLLAIYIILVGFSCAGALGSFWQLWRTEPIGFNVNFDNWTAGIIGVFCCVFAGPFILVRNSIRGRQIEGRPLGWVVAASAIASFWSFCTGLFVMQIALSVG